MNREKNLSNRERLEILFLYKNNVNIQDIALHYEKVYPTIWRVLKGQKQFQKSIPDLLLEFEVLFNRKQAEDQE